MSVESSEGFRLVSRSRFYYHYSEGDRVMQVNVDPSRDPSSGQYIEDVYENSLKTWLPPYDRESITEETERRIQKNISDALTFMDIPYRWK